MTLPLPTVDPSSPGVRAARAGPPARSVYDAVVVGAGFGGLGAALRCAGESARVLVLERIGYPGGCASTFERDGRRYEAGATLLSGLGPRGLFARWNEELGLGLELELAEVPIELRAPGLELPLPAGRDALRERLSALPGTPPLALARFLDHQRRVAEALWALVEEPELLPPFTPDTWLRHARRLPRTAPVFRDVGRSLVDVLRRYGLERCEALRLYLDAQCQITIQCSAAESEAPFALAALDYLQRGAGHVVGGMGALADALVGAVEARGGEVLFRAGVQRIVPSNGEYELHTRRGIVRTSRVIANVLPRALEGLLPAGFEAARELARRNERVEQGWGACMLYYALAADELPERASHRQIVQDLTRALIEGNHLFASLSSAADPARGAPGERTLTVSTHVRLAELLSLPEPERAARVTAIQARMRAGLSRFAPDWMGDVRSELPASPRTFDRFTGRPGGFVGGVPRRVGLRAYRGLLARPLAPGLTMVGDSVFPGQSALACAAGGWRAAGRQLKQASRT